MQDEPRLTASFCIKGASTFRRRQRSGSSCSTTPTEQDTRASRRRSPGCARRSSVRRRPSSSATTFAAAWCANGTKRSISTRPAFFNPSMFRHLCQEAAMSHGASGNQKDDHRTNTSAKHLRRPPPTTPASANFVVSSSARSGQTVALKCQAEVLPSQHCSNVHFLAAIRHRIYPHPSSPRLGVRPLYHMTR